MTEHFDVHRPRYRERWFCIAACLVWAGSVSAADLSRSWLDRMSDAVEYLNYEGTLVHMYGNDTDVLKIVHRVEGGSVTERITALSGSGREIIRNDDEVTCILPDQQAVLVEARDERDGSQSPLRGRLPSSTQFDEDFYTLSLAGTSRVAGRDVVIVEVMPRDAFRYGYRLWLDHDTAMPLKSQLWDKDGNVVEQIMFADINMMDSIPESAVQPSVPMDSFSWKHSSAPVDGSGAELPVSWRATMMPPGFKLAAAKTKSAPEAGQPIEHLVYSDGLASVSVFIEMGVATEEQGEGLSRIGAANAYTTMMEERLITAVGEVPARTVRMISLSVRPIAAAD